MASQFATRAPRLPVEARLFERSTATSRLRYAFLAVAIPRRLLERLEMLHRGFIRCVLGLPRSSQVATTLAEAGVWPLSLLLKQRGFLHIDQLAHAPDRCPLLALLESRPGYRMGELRQIYQAAVGPMPPAVPLHRPAEKALAINTVPPAATDAWNRSGYEQLKLEEDEALLSGWHEVIRWFLTFLLSTPKDASEY
ncbi:hypothetical protein MRX96_020296 [Rhipicephalus microplus]